MFLVAGKPPIQGRSAFKNGVRGGSALTIVRKQADGTWRVVRDANLLIIA